MNDLLKTKIRLWLSNFGITIFQRKYCRYFYDQENFPGIRDKESLTILDVGANIGQSALAFRKNFPKARIYSFEPILNTFDLLKSNSRSWNIQCFPIALGAEDQSMHILLTDTNPDAQTNSLRQSATEKQIGTSAAQEVQVRRLDSWIEENQISAVDILKTDTEGFDLNVLKGAQETLKKGRIHFIVAEVSLNPSDEHHSNFFEIHNYLLPMGYEIYSLFEMTHHHDGELAYMNAMWRKTDG